jgi:hypothetical protein
METLSIFSFPKTLKKDWELLARRFPSLIKVADNELIFISSVYFKVSKVLNYLIAPVILLIGF